MLDKSRTLYSKYGAMVVLAIGFFLTQCAPPVCKIKSCHTKQIHMHSGKDFRWVEPWKFWVKQNYRIGEDVPAKTQDRDLKATEKSSKAKNREGNKDDENFFSKIFKKS